MLMRIWIISSKSVRLSLFLFPPACEHEGVNVYLS